MLRRAGGDSGLVLSHGAEPGKAGVSAGPAPAAAGGGTRPSSRGLSPPGRRNSASVGVISSLLEGVQETWVSPLCCASCPGLAADVTSQSFPKR